MRELIVRNTSMFKGSLILVNEAYPIHENNLELRQVPIENKYGEVMMEGRATALFYELMDKIDGWKEITPVSGLRSKTEQEKIYEDSMLEYGETFTKKYVALPDHSEHQTGLAIDVALMQPEIDFIRPDFPHKGICQIFRKNAIQFGFIQRYAKEKEAITGIAHEPWHFRYVGFPHSMIMEREGITLEEYLTWIKEYPHGIRAFDYSFGSKNIQISYLQASSVDMTKLQLPNNGWYDISGNNIDGFVITIWEG